MADLQFTYKDKAHFRLRKDRAAKMAATRWQKKMVSGKVNFNNQWNWISKDRYMRSIQKISTTAPGGANDPQAITSAFQALIADVGAKESKSTGAGDSNFRTISPDEADDDNEVEDQEDEDEDKLPRKRRRGAYEALAVALPAVPAPPRPVVHVLIVDPIKIRPPPDKARYP